MPLLLPLLDDTFWGIDICVVGDGTRGIDVEGVGITGLAGSAGRPVLIRLISSDMVRNSLVYDGVFGAGLALLAGADGLGAGGIGGRGAGAAGALVIGIGAGRTGAGGGVTGLTGVVTPDVVCGLAIGLGVGVGIGAGMGAGCVPGIEGIGATGLGWAGWGLIDLFGVLGEAGWVGRLTGGLVLPGLAFAAARS